MVKKRQSESKLKGRVFTPEFVVRDILDLSEYVHGNILKKHIIDNSCGDGSFLKEIVSRYCKEAEESGVSKNDLTQDLQTFIHGIELDAEQARRCVENLSSIAEKHGVFNVQWDILQADALSVSAYNGKMDFVVGNPPYVRVHNLENLDAIKKFSFSKEGMTDLYIVFFEIGMRMMNQNGVLGYITPSSYFNSLAGKTLRRHFVQENVLRKVVDYKHEQLFDATTYTAITVLSENGEETAYYEYDAEKKRLSLSAKLSPHDFFIDDKFYFASKDKLKKLKEILMEQPLFLKKNIEVKNGFATLADDFFIRDALPFDEYVVPVLKSSTGKWKKCFFPYKNGALISYNELQRNTKISRYYQTCEESLKKRSLEKKQIWWGFGRSQGINDVEKRKYALNALIRNVDDIKLIECDKGTGIYSGLYVLTDLTFDELKTMLVSKDFTDYVSLLGKYKSGGYYTYSSKDVKRYLEYRASRMQG